MADIARVVPDVQEWLDLKMVSGRYAFSFVLELAAVEVFRHRNTHKIFDAITTLERSGQQKGLTKKEMPFRNPILKGLWHKHYFDPSFMPRNLLEELKRDTLFTDEISKFHGKKIEEITGEIVRLAVLEPYKRRAQSNRLTGESIIYEKELKRNYYLTLSDHLAETDYLRRVRVDAYRELDTQLDVRS